MPNAVQLLNQVGGPTEAQQLAARQPPVADLPTGDDRIFEISSSYGIRWEINGRPQTILPHPPIDYTWR